MKVLVVGSGGREHALVWKINQSPKVSKVIAAPGNPGIARLAECIPIKPTEITKLMDLVQREEIDLTVVGPEQPLAEGIVDQFQDGGLAIFGPTKRAAELEWSKAFAKAFMARHGIPTASYRTFGTTDEAEAARTYVQSASLPVVLKADGLAAGKGVTVCTTRSEAISALTVLLERDSREKLVVEEFLEGEEASVFALTDGERYVTLAPAQDHKQVFDGDQGKNTGGMGAYAPAPIVTQEVLETVRRTIIEPTLQGMAADGRDYRGCLYVGLMITSSGPKVIEYNCRFGDPETQVVLPLYNGDIVDLFTRISQGRISDTSFQPRVSGAAVCVVLASGGYPDSHQVGYVIHGLDDLERKGEVLVFHAGTRREGEALVTAGGRVLGITAIQRDGILMSAITNVYNAVEKISFTGMHYRHDIGSKALVAL